MGKQTEGRTVMSINIGGGEIKELKTDEFLDFIKADFGLSNMVKLAMNHPKLAVRQLFNLVKGK